MFCPVSKAHWRAFLSLLEVVRMLCKVDIQEPEAEVNVRILVLILISMLCIAQRTYFQIKETQRVMHLVLLIHTYCF